MIHKKSFAVMGLLLAMIISIGIMTACVQTGMSDAAATIPPSEIVQSTAAHPTSVAGDVGSSSLTASSSNGGSANRSTRSCAPSSSASQPAPSRPASSSPAASAPPQVPASSQPASAPAPLSEPAPAPTPPPHPVSSAPLAPPPPPPAPGVDIDAVIAQGHAYAAARNMGINTGAPSCLGPIETEERTTESVLGLLYAQFDAIYAAMLEIPEYDPNTVVSCYHLTVSGSVIFLYFG